MAEGVRVKADGFQVDKWMKQLGDRPLYKESRGGGCPQGPHTSRSTVNLLKSSPPTHKTKKRKEKGKTDSSSTVNLYNVRVYKLE